jgi:hypothetical protein
MIIRVDSFNRQERSDSFLPRRLPLAGGSMSRLFCSFPARMSKLAINPQSPVRQWAMLFVLACE